MQIEGAYRIGAGRLQYVRFGSLASRPSDSSLLVNSRDRPLNETVILQSVGIRYVGRLGSLRMSGRECSELAKELVGRTLSLM